MSNLIQKSVNMVPWWMRDRIRKIPVVAQLQRLFFKKYLSGTEFVYKISAGPAKGLNFPIKLPEDKLIWTGTWEKSVSEVIADSVVKNAVSYDIGSHRGFMAGIMALAGSSNVYCFEPNPENIEHLKNLHSINTDFKMEILNYAVADSDGEAEFSIMPESSMGKLSESSFQKDAGKLNTIHVDVRSLDSLYDKGKIEQPGFIKIDVEGAELLVLEGAKKIIELFKPVFVIELHSFLLANQCKSFLEERGYNTKIIQNGINLADERTFFVCHLVARRNK